MRRALAAAWARAGGRRPAHPALVHGVLVAASLPFLVRAAARERDRQLFWTLLAAEQLRFGMAMAHHRVVTSVYAGATDVDEYHFAGREIADRLRAGRYAEAIAVARTVPWDTQLPGPVSTNLMRLLNGAVYAVIGPSKRGAFVVFSWLGFGGLLLFHRAFVVALPRGRSRGYLRLLLLLPSLNFWTSTIGKEPWMIFTLGGASLGAARTVTGSARSGVPLALLGAASAAAMRAQVGGRFGISVGSGLRDAGARSALGASRFSPPEAGSVRDLPLVAGSVLFRPHLLEAHNRQALVAAAEGTFLLALSLARVRWAAAALGSSPRQPYVVFVVGTTAALIAYLSRVANFGMLVRQRVAVLPFYVVLLSIPPRD